MGTRKIENRPSANAKSGKKDDRPLSSKTDSAGKPGDPQMSKQSNKGSKEEVKSADEEEKKFECHGLDRELADMLGNYFFVLFSVVYVH